MVQSLSGNLGLLLKQPKNSNLGESPYNITPVDKFFIMIGADTHLRAHYLEHIGTYLDMCTFVCYRVFYRLYLPQKASSWKLKLI